MTDAGLASLYTYKVRRQVSTTVCYDILSVHISRTGYKSSAQLSQCVVSAQDFLSMALNADDQVSTYRFYT